MESLGIQEELDLTWRAKSVSQASVQRPHKAHRQKDRALKIHIFTNTPKGYCVGINVVAYSERCSASQFTSIKGCDRVRCSVDYSCVNIDSVSYQ